MRRLKTMIKHQEMIDDSHECSLCGLNKEFVKFRVQVYKYQKNKVDKECTNCKLRQRHGLAVERPPVAERIKTYFEEEYMKFKVLRNNTQVGAIYAPNYTTALKRATKMYGLDVDVEEF